MEGIKQANASQTNEKQGVLEITVLFNGVALVNKIKLGPAVENCRQLAEDFLRIVLCEAGDVIKIRVVFDRYLESSIITFCTAKQNIFYSIFWVYEVTPKASVCGILKFTDRAITLK